MPSVDVSHIGTCFPDYLTDHHNRDGELLIGVYVDGKTTVREVFEGVIEEWHATGECVPDEITDEQFIEAVKMELSMTKLDKPFDDSLETDYGDEMPQAWFLVTWEE